MKALADDYNESLGLAESMEKADAKEEDRILKIMADKKRHEDSTTLSPGGFEALYTALQSMFPYIALEKRHKETLVSVYGEGTTTFVDMMKALPGELGKPKTVPKKGFKVANLIISKTKKSNDRPLKKPKKGKKDKEEEKEEESEISD